MWALDKESRGHIRAVTSSHAEHSTVTWQSAEDLPDEDGAVLTISSGGEVGSPRSLWPQTELLGFASH